MRDSELDGLGSSVINAMEQAKEVQKSRPNRALALVITKLEEAALWLTQVEGMPPAPWIDKTK